MAKTDGVWASNWRTSLGTQLAQGGVTSVSEFLRQRSGVTYEALSRELGGGFAPIQLLQLHIDEAQGDADAALDSFSRLLREELRRLGWRIGRRWRERVVVALGWFMRWGDPDELREFGRVLLEMEVPDGWVPESGEDRFLREALERFGRERFSEAIRPA